MVVECAVRYGEHPCFLDVKMRYSKRWSAPTKTFFSLVPILVLILCGCQADNKRPGCLSTSKKMLDVPVDGYRVLGQVQRPGDLSCSDQNQRTLLALIGESGGFTDDAIQSRVRVIHNGSTNIYNVRRIAHGTTNDPVIPCGSFIYVFKNML